MENALNEHGQPIGKLVNDWIVPEAPQRKVISGQYCKLVPLDASIHAAELFQAFEKDSLGQNWTYLPYGPFQELDQFHMWLSEQSEKADPLFFAVVEAESGFAIGVASFMRIVPSMGTIEIGHIHFSPALQGTVAATEALYLMLQNVFALGYRRCEWKCNAFNEASRRAALRLGFSFEGVFRQAGVVKGRNRDTAWFSMLDNEWPVLCQAFELWLKPANFSSGGNQLQRLSELRRCALEDR